MLNAHAQGDHLSYLLLSLVLATCMSRLQWDGSVNPRTRTVGFDNQIAMKMADAFTHSSDADSGALGLNLSQPLRGHPHSLVLNRHANVLSFPRNFNLSSFASRVTMNVCQALLHQSKYQKFHFRWKSSKVVGNPQTDLQAAAFFKTLYIPTQADEIPVSSSIGGCRR